MGDCVCLFISVCGWVGMCVSVGMCVCGCVCVCVPDICFLSVADLFSLSPQTRVGWNSLDKFLFLDNFNKQLVRASLLRVY